MKIDPLSILLNKDFKLDKNFYFISGNEISLIEKLSAIIIERYQKLENIYFKKIETIKDATDNLGLFESKKIYLIRNCKDIDEKIVNKFREQNNVFIFVQENSQKTKKIKNIFSKDKDSFLIDCYELDKNSKVKIINALLGFSNKELEKDLYWFLVEKLDNRYAFLENSLTKILELDQKDINFINIRKLLTIDNTGKDKVFFNIFKKNSEIVETYREKIVTNSDVNEFYYYCKFFCQLIIDSKNEDEYNKKIPIYLFREKSFFLDIYRRFNLKKKKLLLSLLLSSEEILRKENNLSLVFGLRFILSIKKIAIS